jgi:hypothetical protein
MEGREGRALEMETKSQFCAWCVDIAANRMYTFIEVLTMKTRAHKGGSARHIANPQHCFVATHYG